MSLIRQKNRNRLIRLIHLTIVFLHENLMEKNQLLVDICQNLMKIRKDHQ